MKNKVSILTPVYNGEAYVARFIDSIIKQKLEDLKVELIIIDDGSTDKTKEIIFRYINNSKEDNIVIKYIYQENAGQAAAVSKGIKLVSGEFLMWADSDDYFEGNAILKMVNFLKKNKDADIVRCNAYARNEDNTDEILYEMKVPKKYQGKKDIFEDCIFINGINIFSGVYMVRFSKYKKNNPDLHFYGGRQGQNWQLLLPSLYQNDCYYFDEFVYNYVVRKNSHSHTNRSLEQKVERIIGLRDILFNTISILNLDSDYKKNLCDRITEQYNVKLFFLYCKYGIKDKTKELYNCIYKKNLKIHMAYFLGTNKLCNFLYKKIKKEI